MKPHRRATLLAVALLAGSGLVMANAQPSPIASPAAESHSRTDAPAGESPMPPQAERILRAMGNSSTWGHPDLFGQFGGMRHYYQGDFKQALTLFKYGARFSDKLSQAMIGMMHIHGEAVAQDPVTGCAWLMLAADRKYPIFVKFRDHYCGALTPAQREQADAVLATLQPEYGDEVAMQRLKAAMQGARAQRTGSRVGFDMNARTLIDPLNASGDCGGPTMVVAGVPLPPDDSHCAKPNLWAPQLRNPKEYFAARDRQYRGTVTVGPLQDITTSAPGANEKPAPASSAGH